MQTNLSPSFNLDQSNQQYQTNIIGHKPTVLTRIYDDNISACIQTRTLGKDITDYATFICNSHNNIELSLVITPTSITEQLSHALPHHDTRAVFIHDVVTIIDMFSCLFDLEKIGLRLTTLTKAMCPRFHTDRVLCRLITTYLGKGTEWLDGSPIDPRQLNTYNDPHDNIPFFEEAPCLQLKAGDIALFKGDRWEESTANRGVTHRSPQLNPGEVRLLLTLDMIS